MPSEVIAFGGKRGRGKTLAADYLVENYGFKKLSFASKLKEVAEELFPGITKAPKEKPYKNYDWTPRDFMIRLGQFMRYWDPEYWVKSLDLEHKRGKIVIDDLRFKNEAAYLKQFDAKLVRLERYGKLNIYGPQDLDDVSETDLDDYKDWDYQVPEVVNTTPDSLFAVIDGFMKRLKDA